MRTNYTDEQLKRMFTKEVTEYVAHQVSEKEGISYDQAKKNFKISKTYAYLNSDTDFPEAGPADFLDWYQNERKYGRLVPSAEFYYEKTCPEEYAEA